MAKRTRLSARGKSTSTGRPARPRKTAPKAIAQISRSANVPKAKRIVFAPEALAHAGRRYQQTDASLEDIAVDLGVVRNTVRDLARREGWVRYVPPPRGLAPAVLNAQARGLEAEVFDAFMPVTPVVLQKERQSTEVAWQGEDKTNLNIAANEPMPEADTVARLYRAVREELAAVETLRAQLKRAPKSPHDAERTARTLSSLTETLQKLQRLQCAAPQSGSHDDDMPADIDEFRTELARRIEAFVASRSDPGDNGGSIAAPVDAAAG